MAAAEKGKATVRVLAENEKVRLTASGAARVARYDEWHQR
jgi:hypothetical protein